MSLQTIDRQLHELGQSLSSVAERVEQLRGEIETSQAELDRLTEEDQQAAAARRMLERELADGEAQIRNKRMRLNLVRNDKELQALGHEVESLKENNQRLEAEVLASMQAAEPRAPRIKELTELIASKRTELKAAEKEIAARGRRAEDVDSAPARRARPRGRIYRRRAAPALPDDLQPARRTARSPLAQVGHLPGMPDARCRHSSITRSRSIFRSIFARTASVSSTTRVDPRSALSCRYRTVVLGSALPEWAGRSPR